MTRSIGECLLGVRSAIGLLTRIPVYSRLGRLEDSGSRWALAHLPLVGTLIGSIGALVWLSSARLNDGARAWLVIAALLLVTGAFHEDGLADTADALGGASDRVRLFEILKDSRIGSYGALALIVALGLRAALLARLLPESGWLLVVAQTVSRLPPVLLLRCLPYVTPGDSARSARFAQAKTSHVLVASAWAASLCGASVPLASLALERLAGALGMVALAGLWLAWRFRRRAGGVTGDFLGAAQQVSELAFLVGLALQ